MRIKAASLLLALACVAVFAAPAQSDAVIGCGSVVTESVILDHDIGPCPGSGIVVQGGSVTVDLNGHTISGLPGSGAGIRIEGSAALPIADVRMTHGTVQGFGQGVSIFVDVQACVPSSTISVEQLVIRANGTGIGMFGYTGSCMTVNVTGNRIADNAGDGISVLQLGSTHVVANDVVKNGGVGIRGFLDGIRLVEDNFVAQNGEGGIKLDDTLSIVKGNLILKNRGVGLSIQDTISALIPTYVVADNVADGNDGGGMIAGSFPDPPGPPTGSGNAAKSNGNFQCILIKCAANVGQAKKG